MSVNVNGQLILTVFETLASGVPDVAAGNAVITHNKFNAGFQLNASSSPPASQVVSIAQALTGGAATIDLTNLTGTNGAVINGTGLRVQAILIQNTGANTMTVKFGASNPYNIFGASGQVVLDSGEYYMKFNSKGVGGVIGAGAKNIDISGTGSQVLNICIVLG